MPCTLTGSFDGDRALISSTTATYLTQLLCGACKLLEENDIDMSSVTADEHFANADLVSLQTLDAWWADHKKLDGKRNRRPE